MASNSIHSAKNGDGPDSEPKDEKDKNVNNAKTEVPSPGPAKKSFFQRIDLDIITLLLMAKYVYDINSPPAS
jgi:hypothetical protein